MAEADDGKERVNGGVRGVHVDADDGSSHHHTLHGVLYALVATVLFPDRTSPAAGEPFLRRAKISFYCNVPLIPQASRNSAHHLLHWTRGGSPLRALLVISVGTVTLIALTGVVVFMLFFLVATVNAIVISLLMSLAAAGGFLALFFAFVTAVYIGALVVAISFISTATFFTIVGVLVATGWAGFFLTAWLAMKKSVDLAKHSLSATQSAMSSIMLVGVPSDARKWVDLRTGASK
ncbi:uncharacterized protein LOC116202608 [Punica granatum]|uniref:Uncharacterized protein n=2 Tax=Punica granatum TaxID=22663 RepID=A0A218XIC6_PUNGR|nr:uncharacterized protein LOC116202608 [Punica granatum]OWM84965.1 hypothetical protein CDL15_Pgr027752 [Punica granatum]PKI45955.1 hypothetical protein CRG98_033595 [Punica granatum]